MFLLGEPRKASDLGKPFSSVSGHESSGTQLAGIVGGGHMDFGGQGPSHSQGSDLQT